MKARITAVYNRKSYLGNSQINLSVLCVWCTLSQTIARDVITRHLSKLYWWILVSYSWMVGGSFELPSVKNANCHSIMVKTTVQHVGEWAASEPRSDFAGCQSARISADLLVTSCMSLLIYFPVSYTPGPCAGAGRLHRLLVQHEREHGYVWLYEART